MAGRRAFSAERCPACGVHTQLCVCDQMPHLDLATRIVVVQHNRERNKPTNTGRLVDLMLENCVLVRHAVRGQSFDPTPLCEPDIDYHLLFPREDAVPLEAAALRPRLGRRAAIVVLDGTWAQCSRMSRRVPVVAKMACLAVPEGPPSHWGIRSTEDPRRLSTLDCVIRSLAIVEGPETARRLATFFDLVTARLLYMRGKLASPDPPAAWREDAARMWQDDGS